MCKDELKLILDYIKRLSCPNRYMKKENFKQLSYTRWAANEVLIFVLNRPLDPPVSSVEAFAAKMDEYACKSNENGYVFSIAYDVAMDILDQLLEVRK